MLDIHTHRIENTPDALYSLTPPRGFRPAPGIRYSVGVHPWVEGEYRQLLFCSWDELEALARHPQIAAIGEAGLDRLHRPLPKLRPGEAPCLDHRPMAADDPGWSESLRLFERHALLAEAVGKPLILHCVRAADAILAVRARLRPSVPWILHGFRGKPMQARQLMEKGLLLSLGERFHPETARCIPLEKLLVETDESLLPVAEIIRRIALARLGLDPFSASPADALPPVSAETVAELTRHIEAHVARLLGPD